MMLRDFEQKVAEFITAEGLIKPGERVLLAVSGGADSTCLLYVLAALKLNICCCHINHQLRGDDSQRDEVFVSEMCRKLNLPVFTKQIDVKGYARSNRLSIETAARKLRIDALIEIAARQKCSCIATAHQQNDNAETILQRLSRGTGLRGLCGIWPVKQFSENINFVRPLLCVNRPEILEYLKTGEIKWCEDRTNLDCSYRRNFIRNRLLPVLQKDFKTNLVEQIARLSKSARGFYRIVCTTADAAWPKIAVVEKESISLDANVLQKRHPEVQIEIVRRVMSHLAAGEQDITENHYNKILKLSADAKLQLPDDLEVCRQSGVIIFGRCQPRQKAPGFMPGVNLMIPGKTEFAGVLIEAEIFEYNDAKFNRFKANKSNTVEWFDFDKLKLPLEVRFRKPGDRFWPLGLPAEKKVGKFLTDEKIPQKARRKSLVIEDAEKIIWLCPVRISDKVKITNQTGKILQLKVGD